MISILTAFPQVLWKYQSQWDCLPQKTSFADEELAFEYGSLTGVVTFETV